MNETEESSRWCFYNEPFLLSWSHPFLICWCLYLPLSLSLSLSLCLSMCHCLYIMSVLLPLNLYPASWVTLACPHYHFAQVPPLVLRNDWFSAASLADLTPVAINSIHNSVSALVALPLCVHVCFYTVKLPILLSFSFDYPSPLSVHPLSSAILFKSVFSTHTHHRAESSVLRPSLSDISAQHIHPHCHKALSTSGIHTFGKCCLDLFVCVKLDLDSCCLQCSVLLS